MQETREEWLNKSVLVLTREIFEPNGFTVPRVSVSIGFTGSSSKKVIGVCWKGEATENKQAQIYIVPTINDSLRILDILAHELIHAIFPNAGHKGDFRKCAKAIGLTGKMTATVAGDELKARLNTMIKDELGLIPHCKLNTRVGAKKKQTTRMKKCVCDSCGFTFRTSQKCIDMGLPVCSCGENFAEVA